MNLKNWNMNLEIRTKLSAQSKTVDLVKTIPVVSEVLNPKNIKIAQRESLMWGTHQQEAISYGNVIHEILSFVKDKSDIDLAVTKAIENGLITFDQTEKVLKTIQEIVTHPELSICFDGKNNVLTEQTIIQKEGRILKPDRIVLTENQEAYLLDYKTGAINSKYASKFRNIRMRLRIWDTKC